ncbi:prepilin-type N-terminal cleavage/methylation domain-containing protein [bacterium]|nr:prepilin-type N-terminal cleavage/methylation domain-containing protein [bacterium]
MLNKYPQRLAFSMIELLIGIVIFSLAMLPLLSLAMSSSRGAYSVGKHMMAGQIAQESQIKVSETSKLGKINLLEDDDLKSALTTIGNEAISWDLNRQFKNFTYEVIMREPSGEDKGKMFLVAVKVGWRVDEGKESSRQFMTISSIKYKDVL